MLFALPIHTRNVITQICYERKATLHLLLLFIISYNYIFLFHSIVINSYHVTILHLKAEAFAFMRVSTLLV